MPRMAQPGTTTNLRRLAGRRTPTSGGPHIPLDSNELPPVLFRLPEVSTGSPSASVDTSGAAPSPMAPPSAVGNTTSAPLAPTSQTHSADSEDAGQNVFNHVAGAVTGAVAGTVANSVAVAGTLAGSALAATPFGSSTSTTRSFSSAAASLSPLPALEPAAKPRPVVRPIPESAETDTRSWWEHWSSGIILMLLILALVTAGIMAIRDPERSRATNRPIADEPVETALPPSPISSNNENATNNKPALASTTATSSTPAASASLSPSLLPDPSTANNNSTSSRVPSFTLNPNPNAAGQNQGANASTNNPAMLADKSGFVSSNTPSPGAAASQGSAFPNASRFAAGNTSGTPAISASTQLNPSGSGEFEATVPATENNNSNTPAPSLSWPVEQDPATDAARSQHQSSVAVPNPNELTLLDEEPETELKLPATSEPVHSTETQATNSTTNTLAAPATTAPAVTVSPTAPSSIAPTATNASAEPMRAAYRETALPNEDLESILEMRRHAMSNARMVSNQYFADPNAQAAAMPIGNTMTPNQTMPSQYNPNQAMPMQGQMYQGHQFQGQQPQGQQPQGQQYQGQQYQGQPQPMQQQPQGQINPNTGFPWQTQPSPNQGAPLNGVNYNQPTTGNSSQGVGTRSWTYNPNTSNGTNSWTLPASGAAPTAASPPATTGGYQIDPNYARQLGYGQNNPTAPVINQTNPSGWNNQAAANRTPTIGMPSQGAAASGVQNNVPNIMAPAGSMVVPNQGGAMPNTQQYSPNNNVPQGYPAGYQR